MSGLLLGLFISAAVPSLTRMCVGPFLYVENNILRRDPSKTSVFFFEGGIDRRDFVVGMSSLMRRSFLIALTLAIAYSEIFPIVFPAQSTGGIPVVIPAFVALLGFYSTIIPAVVSNLESKSYLVRRHGEPDRLLSEIFMRWVAIGVTLPALIAVLRIISNFQPFTEKPISILYAFLNFMPAPFAILGSCISIQAFLPPLSRYRPVRYLGILGLIVVLAYRNDFFDFVFLRQPGTVAVSIARFFGEFITGTIFPFGFYWYPVAVVAGVMMLVVLRKRNAMGRVVALAFLTSGGIIFGIVPLVAANYLYPWPLWVPTIDAVNVAALGYLLILKR